jgi:hypothetical protein
VLSPGFFCAAQGVHLQSDNCCGEICYSFSTMAASLVTLFALACFVLWIFKWQHQSRLAVGIGIGVVLGAIGASLVGAIGGIDHMPVWAPALPFALIAISLFGFGLLAWFWGEN